MIMKERTLAAIAEGYGLTVETVVVPGNENAIKVYKGARQIFVGTEQAVREFLDGYKSPGLYEGSMYGYKE